MCGIIGILGNRPVAGLLVDGLKRLEYRGYDSSGIATLEKGGAIVRCRAEGKITNLEATLENTVLQGHIGIGHTRWATHGVPSTRNAHPHATQKVAVVHNGIIENFGALRKELEKTGHVFETETDTEVVPHLLTHFLSQGSAPLKAVQQTLARLEGAYALGILFAGEENLLIAARQGSPLAIGYGSGEHENEMYLGSDAMALAILTSDITYLEEGDIAVLSRSGVTFYDHAGAQAQRAKVRSNLSTLSIGKENYRHFMQKEIFEQPRVVGDVLHAYYNAVTGKVTLPKMDFSLSAIEQITIVACGTSYYAGFIARYWLEQLAKLPVEIDVASEFRYREAIFTPPTAKPGSRLALFISQSGETADTLAAMRYAKSQGLTTVAVVNVQESTMAREADLVLPIYCGPEIGVASTKAFTAQLVTLACFVIALSEARGSVDQEGARKLTYALSEVPSRMAELLNHDSQIRELSQEVALARDILYIGRGVSYGIALEGALKLKEISYIHAEAAAAGELKHGTIALIDEKVPVIAIAPSDRLFDKTASNIREVAARGGKVLLLSDAKGLAELKDIVWHSIILPEAADFVTPILYAVPVQLLAYHVAVTKGTDVDQPRNLAKSVTVE